MKTYITLGKQKVYRAMKISVYENESANIMMQY